MSDDEAVIVPLTHVEGFALLGGHGTLRVLERAGHGVLLEIHYPMGSARLCTPTTMTA